MTLKRSPLLIALFPLLAVASPPGSGDDAPQVTPLPAVRATVDAPSPQQSGLDAWGAHPLHETPAAVTVITREQLDAMMPRSLSDLARADTAIGDNYAPVGYYQNLAIRGHALDLGTGYRINNLAMTGEQAIALEDKEQVQILKGLAGLSAGVMEPGGIVNFISKRPQDVRALTVGSDSHGSLYTALDAGTWLSPTFGVRANVAWEDMHAYVRHADGRRRFYALAADWKLGERTVVEIDGNYQTSAQRSVSGYQLLGGQQLPATPDPRKLLGFQPWQAPVAIRASNASARIRHDLGAGWQLNAAAGRSRSVIDDNVAFAYGCWYVDACAAGAPPNYFAPDGSYDIYDYRNPDDTRVGDYARLSLQGTFRTGAATHAVSVGGSAFHRSIDRHRNVNAYVGTGSIDDDTPPVFAPSPKQVGPKVRRLDSWQRSAFVLDQVSLGDHWRVLAGAQFVRLHERARSKYDVLERETALSRTLPQAALLWLPTSALTAYASFSKGLSLGREAPSWTSNDGELLAPRISRQWEAGFKYADGGRLSAEAALFRIRQPYQYARPDSSSAGFAFVQRGQEVHTGLEATAVARLTDTLRLQAGASVIRARATGTGSAAFDGQQVVNAPRYRTRVQLDYAPRATPDLTLQGGWRHVAANPATPDGAVMAGAYDVFDLGARYATTIARRSVTWQLGIDNLFDTRYWRDTGSSLGDNYLFPGVPRLARLTVRIAL